MAEARALQVNPVNPEQALILWSDGRIVARGPNTPDPNFNANWDRGSWNNIGRDLIVTDWTTPSGYVLSGWGSIQTFGAATKPDALGIKAPDYKIRNDFWWRLFMDPNGTGGGYMVSKTGLVFNFGGAPSVTAPSSIVPGGLAGFGDSAVRGFDMEWSSKKFVILDRYGVIHRGGGLAAITLYDFSALQRLLMSKSGSKVKFDLARAIQVVDWGSTPKGYVLDAWGTVHTFGGAEEPAVKPSWPMSDRARDLIVSSYPSNFQYTILDRHGYNYLVTASTAPEVTVVAPISGVTLTDTKRPLVSWFVEDDQGDPQANVKVKVFTAAQYGAGGFSPDTSTPVFSFETNDPTVRAVEVDVDLTNTTHRAYVQVTEELGLKSAWAYSEFTVNVTPLPTPSVAVTFNNGSTNYSPYASIVLTSNAAQIGYRVQLQRRQRIGPLFSAYGDWEDVPRITDGKLYVSDGGSGSTVTIVDDEYPAEVQFEYRMRTVNDATDGVYNTSAWVSVDNINQPLTQAWIVAVDERDGTGRATAMPVNVVSFTATTGKTAGVFRPLGATNNVVIQGTGRYVTFDVELVCKVDASFGLLDHVLRKARFLLRSPQFGTHYMTVDGEHSVDFENAKPVLAHATFLAAEIEAI